MAAACAAPEEPPTVRSLPAAPDVVELPAPPEDTWPPDLGPFTTATLTVPAWGADVTACPVGRLHLAEGGYYPGSGPVTQLWVQSYVATDIDRDGSEDFVALLRCGEGPEAPGWQVAAFRRSGAELKPMGRVVGSQDGLAMVSGVEARDGGRVAVNLGREYVDIGAQFTPHQWRTYGLDGGQFRQVDGPTSFPADPPAARLSVDPAELVLRPVAGGVYAGELTVTVRNSGDADVAGLDLALILPDTVVTAGAGWDGCTRSDPPREPTTRIECEIGALAAHSQAVFTFELVTAGTPSVTSPPAGSGYRPDDSLLWIRQRPPYTYEIAQNPEADVRIVVA